MDPLLKPIRILHNLGIFCFVYFFCYNLYFLLNFIFWFFGFTSFISFPFPLMISYGLALFFAFIEFIVVHILIFLIVTLYWVFIFWLLIILFVPFIIVIPIPIIPYVFILPLKPLLLAIIPPFKTLTDLGTIQLVYRVFTRIFTTDTIKNWFILSATDLTNYLFSFINEIFVDLFGDDLQKYFNVKEDTVDHSNDLKDLETIDKKEDIDTYDKYKKEQKVQTNSEKIDYETELCVTMKQKFKLYNSDYLDEISGDITNSYSPYSECYANAIKSYLKTSIG